MKTRQNFVSAWSREDLVLAATAMMRFAGWSLALMWVAYTVRFSSILIPIRALFMDPETATQLSNAKAEWGQFGEFVGGTLGPIVSLLALVGLVFTILIQHEAMISVQKDAASNLKALSDQTRLSLEAARLQALAAALEVTSEMHRQAQAINHGSAKDLLDKKERLAGKILEISDQLDSQAQAADGDTCSP